MKLTVTLALVFSAGLAAAQSTTTTDQTTTTGTTTSGSTATATTSTTVAPIPNESDGTRTTLFRRGMFFVGGRVNLGLSNGDQNSFLDTAGTPLSNVNGVSFGIAPRVGVFLSDHFALGAFVSYDRTTSSFKRNNSTFERSAYAFGAGVFARYASGMNGNMYDGKHTFGWFTDLGVDYSTGKVERTNAGVKRSDPNTQFGVGLSPGVIWFPNPRIGLEASLGQLVRYSVSDLDLYGNGDTEPDGGEVTVGLRAKGSNLELLNLNTMGLKIGFSYYFNAGR